MRWEHGHGVATGNARADYYGPGGLKPGPRTIRGQQRVLWGRVERLCDRDEPRAKEVGLLFDNVRAAPAVLTFLRDRRVGRIVPEALRRRTEGERGGEVDREREGDEGVPGPP